MSSEVEESTVSKPKQCTSKPSSINNETTQTNTTDPIASFSIQSITFKKRKKKSKKRQILKPSAPNTDNNNKRTLEHSDHDHDHDEPIIHPKKRRKLNHSKNANDFHTESAIKTTKSVTNSTDSTLATFHSYSSDRSVLPSGLEGQGAAVNVFVENENDSKCEIEKKPSITSDGNVRYRGLKTQHDVRSDKSVAIKKAPKFLGIGPQRAPDNVKITCRFDYQPDICKDWKETGFCGYGPSCKFLHDRGDYKAGWQIERDWQKFLKKKEEKLSGNHNNNKEEVEENWEIRSDDEEEEMDNDGLPFACYICRDGFEEPVVTKCGHYFCSECAIKRYGKSDGCAACGTKTEGSFTTATKLAAKLKKRKK